MKNYLHPSQDAGKQFFIDFQSKGKVVMLNLLKFKDIADYSEYPALQPSSEITGREAYKLYMECTYPHLKKAGGRVLFYGQCQHFLIGPEAEKWDSMLLVEHASAEVFIAFAQDEGYLKTAGHRTAALEDSRLLPLAEDQFA